MKITLEFLILLAFIALGQSASKDRNDKPYKIVCYWGSWSYYRDGKGKFTAEDVNPNLCTHLMYGFAKLNDDNTIGVFEHDLDLGDTDWNSGLEWGVGMYRRFNHLRDVNPHLTTMISIGGWNEGSDKYSKMVSTAASRSKFVKSVVEFLQTYSFDGLDLDWEYPASKAVGGVDRTPGNLEDKANYIALVKELKEAFKAQGFLLSAAVSAGKPVIDRAYDVKQLSGLLDFINVMTYDFHGAWENRTAHNTPLYPHPDDNELDKEYTVSYAMNYWEQLGADPKKLMMGLATYGRSFTLANKADFGEYAKAVGTGGHEGHYTREAGIVGYNEICEFLKATGWKVYRDDVEKVPYMVNGDQWIGYDDVQSIKEKLAVLKAKKYGGAIIWSVDTDDFSGNCGGGKYPIMKVISGELNGVTGPDTEIHEVHVTQSPGTKPPKVTTPKPGGTTKSGPKPTDGPVTGDFECKSVGSFSDPKNNKIFHTCVDAGNGKFIDYITHCPDGTVYDGKICRAGFK